MPSLAKTKRRINSIKGTEKITKAMELVATVKTKRFSTLHDKGYAYSQEFLSLVSQIFAYDKEGVSHYGKMNEGDLPVLYLVISSNMGLCGAYNNNVFKFAEAHLKDGDFIAPIGNKAVHHYSSDPKYAKNVIVDFSSLNLDTDMDKVHLLASKLKEDFNSKKYKAIRIIYTRYVNSITFEPTVFQILPVQVPKVKWTDDEFAPPLFDEEPRTMLHQVLPSYLTGILHEIVLDSFLSEQASRRTAMDNANDNADELLGKLTIEYNKARQGAITQQITEVASGANAGE